MIKIRILDDEPNKRESFRNMVLEAGVPSEYDIKLIRPEEVKASFVVMLARQSEFREHGHWTIEKPSDMPLDGIDILILDNELREFFQDIGVLTSADEVAYMARCFSTCKLILIVNRTTPNPFDLTGNASYLGQFEAFSDLEIGQAQLSSKALWGTGDDVFHPWYWFVLPKWLAEFDRRLQDAKTALRDNAAILSFFGLEDVKEWLPRRVLQTLGDGQEYTIGEFVLTSSFVLGPRDRATLGNFKLDEPSIENLAPIVAARLWKWLEVQVLPELDILVDAPHLVMRFPSLLEGEHSDFGTWNAVAVRHFDHIPNMKMELLEAHRFSREHWLSRPAWYWRKVMNEDAIPDAREPWNIEYVPLAFCEDTSLFALEEEAKSYRAAVDSPFGSRYIKKLRNVDYQPLQRLAI